jgi:type IV pilus assembly protein PilC
MRSKDSGDISALVRHLARLVERTGDVGSATAQLREVAPKDLQEQVGALGELIAGSSSDSGGSMAMMRRLLHHVGTDVRDRARALIAFERSRTGPSSSLGSLLEETRSRTTYLAALSFIGALIAWVAVTLVLPSFAYLFEGLGSQLPAMTQGLLAADGLLGYFIVLLFLLVGAAVVSFSHTLRRSVEELRPLPSVWQRLPGFRGPARYLQYMLFLIYADALRSGGVAVDEAMRHSRALSAFDDAVADRHVQSGLLALSLASQTDSVGDELEHQLRGSESMHSGFNNGIRMLTAVLSSLVAVLVGLLVISLYLPIFRMGSLI